MVEEIKLNMPPSFSEIYVIDEVPIFKTFIAGEWLLSDEVFDIKTLIDGSLIARVSKPSQALVEESLTKARGVGGELGNCLEIRDSRYCLR